MIVICSHYRAGRREDETTLDLDAATRIATGDTDDGFVWLGLIDPVGAELADLGRRFGLPELAVEDAMSAHERPKVDLYPETGLLFTVVRAARYDDEGEQVI